MQIPLMLDRALAATLTYQLTDQLRAAIRQKRIPPGARLPSSRRLSEQANLSRNTVVRAYDQLMMEGYVEARPASGMFVPHRLPEDERLSVAPPDTQPDPGGGAAMPSPRLALRAQGLVGQGGGRISFDFFPGRPNAGLFPLKAWRRLLQGCLSHGGAAGLAQYGDPAGLHVLRMAIAEHLAATRGIVAEPGRIVIVGGIQEGLGIAARLLLGPGLQAAVEDPCYQGAVFSFEATGARIVHLPVDEVGLVPAELPDEPTTLLYLTPSHQYPTGGTLPAERRAAIVAWARRTGCYLVEDDYDSDFRYEGSPMPAIAAQAPDCTLYLGTFSKSLGAGLRLGYMVVPDALADAVRTAKTLLNNGNSWLDQATLAEFIRTGSYAAHLVRIRARYRESRDCLIAALRHHFGAAQISGAEGGLHLLWHLPAGVPDAATLEAMARRVRVGLYPLAAGGAFEAQSSPLGRRGIVLGYACLTPRQIEQGIARISDAIDDTLDREPGLAEVWLDEARRTPDTIGTSARGRTSSRPASSVRHRPALRAGPAPRAFFPRPTPAEDRPVPVISGIYRYPIKGLSPQAVPGATLEAGRAFPKDRVFALARPGVPIDEEDPKWAKKGLFVMLMLDEALARVRTSLDVDTNELSILEGNREHLRARLDDDAGRARVETFFHALVPALRAPPRLVRSVGGHFMDKPDNVLSLINLATVRQLEEQWGVEIDPLRFRANFYLDGAPPWEEFDWIGGEIQLGDAVFRVDRRNGRCGATNVNPANGRRDLDIPASLRAAFGHKDLGVYLVTRKGGKVVVGDPACVPGVHEIGHRPVFATPPADGRRRFICRGCYYIYDEHAGAACAAPFATLPADWRCPDCGTEKSTFRPYVTVGAMTA